MGEKQFDMMDLADHLGKRIQFLSEVLCRKQGEEDYLTEGGRFGLQLFFYDITSGLERLERWIQTREKPASLQDMIKWAKGNPKNFDALILGHIEQLEKMQGDKHS